MKLNPRQEQMAILDIINSASTASMLLVGDPDQSIYEWRNASPEYFIDKMTDEDWTTLSLSHNFRSSQRICDATNLFSYHNSENNPNIAKGLHEQHSQLPLLILYGDNCTINDVINKFLTISDANNIDRDPDNIAIVTRRRINSETDINGLWKSIECEMLGRACYEWFLGTKSHALNMCEKALFGLTIQDLGKIKGSLEEDVEKYKPYSLWKLLALDILTNLPSANIGLLQWVSDLKSSLSSLLLKHNIGLRNGVSIDDFIKIKSRDKNVPHFHSIPLKQFFEKKKIGEYTTSSIHGVKGESYQSLLLYISSKTGNNTLTPAFLNEGDLNQELMRIAYVAMTRPRKLLAVAMPHIKSRKKGVSITLCNRFSY